MSFKLPMRWGNLLIMALLTAAGAISTLPQQTFAQEDPQPTIEVESSNPMSGDPDAIHTGGKLFMKWCAACHGIHADGNSRFGAYAKDLRKFWAGYAQFIVIVTAGRPKLGMPPWGKYLSGMEIARIGAYLETLAIKGAQWK